MASYNIRPNGVLQYDLCIYGQRFRETSALPATPSNIKRVAATVKKINAQLALKTFQYRDFFPDSSKLEQFEALQRDRTGNPTDPFLQPFSEYWFELNQPSWKKGYAQSVNGDLNRHIRPYFGNWRVGQITRTDVKTFRNFLLEQKRPDGQRKMGNKRINQLIVLLGGVLRYAKERFGFAVATEGLKPLRSEPTDPRPLTLAEVDTFLKAVDPFYHDYYLIRFYTGLRGCEINGLLHEQLDFNHRLIRVRTAWVKGELTDLKTSYSRRDIPMIEPVFEALKRASERTKETSMLVFLNTKNRPLDNCWLAQKAWYPALREAGLRCRPPHQTRHTAAVLHLAAHESPVFISRILGHSSTKLLFEVYAPYVHNAARKDGQAFEAMLDHDN